MLCDKTDAAKNTANAFVNFFFNINEELSCLLFSVVNMNLAFLKRDDDSCLT
jgi:hypothetical protein